MPFVKNFTAFVDNYEFHFSLKKSIFVSID